MSHDIYLFGSLTRGEVSSDSDIDILVVPDPNHEPYQYPGDWSVYSRSTIASYYAEGRLFAWHLYLEAKCVHSASNIPWLASLGQPTAYRTAASDIDSLATLLQYSIREIRNGTASLVFELGLVYTAVRDIAMCASWSQLNRPCFSRRAPYLLPVRCPLEENVYNVAMTARHCSTRGGRVPQDCAQAAEIIKGTQLDAWVARIRGSV